MSTCLEDASDSGSQDVRDETLNVRKARILEAAELLFSGNAYEAVSVRDIATAAGVNSALVGYYFGNKEQLFRELFERRYHLITAERLARIQALDLRIGSLESLSALVRSWTEPLLTLRDDPNCRNFIVLLAREASDPASDRHGIFKDYLDPSARVCIANLKKVFPRAERKELTQAYLWMVACMMSTITGSTREARLANTTSRPAFGDAMRAERLQRFVAGGIWALLS